MNIHREQIADEVRAYLANDLRPGTDPSYFHDDRTLISSGLMDSVAIARLITFLEQRYPVEFEAWELGVRFLDTIGRIARTVHEKVEGG